MSKLPRMIKFAAATLVASASVIASAAPSSGSVHSTNSTNSKSVAYCAFCWDVRPTPETHPS